MENKRYKPFKDIDFGFSDAEGYISSNKDMFNQVFILDDLQTLLQKNIYYLIGEKGTGKTAFAVFFENNDYGNTTSVRMNLEDTDITPFITLKKRDYLPLSGYKDIWDVVLLINALRCIRKEDLEEGGEYRRKVYDAVVNVLEEYGLLAYSPEVVTTVSIIRKDANSIAGDLNAKIPLLSSSIDTTSMIESTETKEIQVFQHSIKHLKKMLSEIIKQLRLRKNRFLFIDKIDVYNSETITFDDYRNWIKYLAEATYYVNNTVFGSMKGKGYMKIVLLLRPDIFDKLGIYNQGNRIRDNSYILDWQTTYKGYKNSKLYKLADNLLRYANKEIDKQDKKRVGYYWDLYFGWKADSTNPTTRDFDDAFISFLRLSLCRPRDIVEFLKSIKQQAIEVDSPRIDTTKECFYSYKCQKSISDYFLQEARDWCLYKYPNGEFDSIRYFFSFMNTGKPVNYSEYVSYYNSYINSCRNRSSMVILREMETPEEFLQLLYELNMVCYIETLDNGDTCQMYCYRLRSISDLSPKIPPNKEYRVHRALLKSLNIEAENKK